MKATLRHSGAKGPFQGLSATLLRNAPANAIYLGSFEVLKQKAAAWKGCEVKDLSAPIVMAAGGTGGILYWLAIFPGECCDRVCVHVFLRVAAAVVGGVRIVTSPSGSATQQHMHVLMHIPHVLWVAVGVHWPPAAFALPL